ncbi:ATP-grasp domain-containing protein [Streptomyces kutzneri]|uniref:ATP-grasp domain-containing protein n=1 Tax=Streptomyces kutzneri TaxID=3051179 RepID=UPI0028D1DC6D|nr:ATP-grasp domain-containing protein [Streptomyces sp. DSM 40907]
MTTDRPAVLLVDPSRTTAGYKTAARAAGYLVVSLYTCTYTTTRDSHADGDDVTLYGEVNDTGAPETAEEAEQAALTAVRELRRAGLRIHAVIPALEVSTHIADRIAALLGLPGNDHTLAWARRNKAAMRERAHRAGLRIPEFRRVRSVSDIAAAAHEIGFPAILKPTLGSAAKGVTLLRDAEALCDLNRLETHDAFDRPIREWLVEEYVRGPEIQANFYSFGGEHRLVDMWQYRQPDDRDYDFPIWDSVRIDASHPRWHEVERYVRQALDAYGIEHGPSHTEVKCAEDGVHLMEIASRLPGGPVVGMWEKHTDLNPFADGLSCFLGERPATFDAPVAFHGSYGALAIRNDDEPGTLSAIHGLDAVDALDGIDEVLIGYQPGDLVPVTSSGMNIPLGFYVSGSDGDAVLRTLATIRAEVSLEIARRPADRTEAQRS